MPVQVQREDVDHCRVALTIQVPPEDIQKAVDSVFNQVAKRTTVPGFRPGKAPRHLVKRFVDEGRVREMAMDQALNNAYRDALKQTGVDPYREADPKVEMPEEQANLEEGFTFKATVPLQPHVHLGELDGLSARKVTVKVTPEEVDREIERYRQRLITYQPTEEPAQEGDRVRATVEISRDGAVVPEASFTEPALLQIGTNLEGFDAGITGAKAGDEKSFDFTYPEDFTNEELRGKTATARVNVVEVLHGVLPELDDEFAGKLGLDTLEALKSTIEQSLQAQADAVSEQEIDDQLVREIVRRSEAHFPEEMVDREVADRASNLLQALERRQLTLDDYLAAENKDLATFQEESRSEARESIVTTLVLLELARQNQVYVTEQDVEDEIKRRAESENVKLSQMRRLLNDTGEIAQIRNRIFFRKVADFLRSKAEVKEVAA